MAIDDHSRVGFGEMLPDEHGGTAAGFLVRTVRGLRRLGVRIAAVMTDNGSCYRPHHFAAICSAAGAFQRSTGGWIESDLPGQLVTSAHTPLIS